MGLYGIATPYQNPGAHLWETGKDIVYSVANGISELKNNPNASADLWRLAGDLTKGGFLRINDKVASGIKNWSTIVDGTQAFVDGNFFLSGAWRDATIYTIAQEFFFLSSELFGMALWGAELGFYTLASSVSVLVASTATAAAGFLALGANSAVMFYYSDNKQQSTYHFLTMARSAAASGGFGVFSYATYATAAGVTVSASALPLATALLCTSIAISTLAFFYKKGYGNEKLIEKMDSKPELDYFKLNVDRKGGKANFISKLSEGAATVFDSTDLTEKFTKFANPTLEALVKSFKWLKDNNWVGDWANTHIITNEGIKNLGTQLKLFSRFVSGLNLLNRIAEWTKLNEEGEFAWQKEWSSAQFYNRIFLTGGHFIEFLKLLTWADLINLGKVGADITFAGCTFNIMAAKEILISFSSGFGMLKASQDATKAKDIISAAQAKVGKKLDLLENAYRKDGSVDLDTSKILIFSSRKYSRSAVLAERNSGEKVLPDGTKKPITEVAIRRHELFRDLTLAQSYREKAEVFSMYDGLYSENLKKKTARKEEIERGLFRGFFRWKELRDLTKAIKDDQQALKAVQWYNNHFKTGALVEGSIYPTADSSASFLQPGVRFTFADGVAPVALTNSAAAEIPAGTKITLPYGAGKTLTVTLTEAITVQLPKYQYSVTAGQEVEITGRWTNVMDRDNCFRSGVKLVFDNKQSVKDLQKAVEPDRILQGTKIHLPFGSQSIVATLDNHQKLSLAKGCKAINESESVIKIQAEQQSGNTLLMRKGVKFTLPAGHAPINIEPNYATLIPKGTVLTIPNGHKIENGELVKNANGNLIPVFHKVVLYADAAITLKAGQTAVLLEPGKEVEIKGNANDKGDIVALSISGGLFSYGLAFKGLCKAYRWTQIRSAHEHLRPEIEKKSWITKWYETGKITCCIIGFTTTVTAATASWLWLFCFVPFIPTGIFGIWKGVNESHLNNLKKNNLDYQVLQSSIY